MQQLQLKTIHLSSKIILFSHLIQPQLYSIRKAFTLVLITIKIKPLTIEIQFSHNHRLTMQALYSKVL